jgi:predicted MFS family arabinose efflux permease
MMISLSMEIIPQGKAGLFDGMVSLGAAIGAFLGPFIANTLNYIPTFLITAVLFLAAFAVLKILR